MFEQTSAKNQRQFLKWRKVVALGLFLSWLPFSAEAGKTSETLRHASGVELHYATKNIGLFRPHIRFRDMFFYNPSGFGEPVMLDVAEVYAEYRYMPLLKGHVHLKYLSVMIDEVSIIRDAEGRINLSALRAWHDTAWPRPFPGFEAPESPLPPVTIDQLVFSIDRIVYVDKKSGERTAWDTSELRGFEFEAITNPADVFALIVKEALRLSDLETMPL